MIKIREEQAGDIEVIREINIIAFEQPEEANLVDELRQNYSDLLSLVAEFDAKVVGHILFSAATIESNGEAVKGMGLAPMAVLPEYQNMGIGSKMVKEGVARLKETKCPFIIVLGYPRYYPKFGFTTASRYNIECEWEVPDDAFMVLMLDNDVMEGVSGMAKYLPEFAEVT